MAIQLVFQNPVTYTCYIELSSLLLYKINYVIVKMVTPYFHWSSLLSYVVPSGIAYLTGNIRALNIVNTRFAET